MKITTYKNIETPKVKSLIDLSEFINTVKNGDEHRLFIESARQHGKGHPKYDEIKSEKLPTYRFNFLIDGYAKNKNITVPTGIIYLDVDNTSTPIEHNEFIFAKWKSLSGNGFGLLFKVSNLTIDNFGDVYDELAELIGVTPDPMARKPIQQTVLSYDSEMYYNPNSKTYTHTEIKKVLFHPTKEKEREHIDRNKTFLNNNNNKPPIRFDNIDEYFEDDTPYILFEDDKEPICDPYIPKEVKKGKRMTTLNIYLTNVALLNPMQGENFLLSCATSANWSFKPPLPSHTLKKTVNYIIRKRSEGQLTPYFNNERRIIFNPILKMNRKQKMEITNKEMGKLKREKTKGKIYDLLESWDFEIEGKITQKKVSILTGLHLSSIKRYWELFKDFASRLNTDSNTLGINRNKEPEIGLKLVKLGAKKIDIIPMATKVLDKSIIPLLLPKIFVVHDGYVVSKSYREFNKSA